MDRSKRELLLFWRSSNSCSRRRHAKSFLFPALTHKRLRTRISTVRELQEAITQMAHQCIQANCWASSQGSISSQTCSTTTSRAWCQRGVTTCFQIRFRVLTSDRHWTTRSSIHHMASEFPHWETHLRRITSMSVAMTFSMVLASSSTLRKTRKPSQIHHWMICRP